MASVNYYPNMYAPYTGYQYMPPQYSPVAQTPSQSNQQISTGILWVGNEQEAQNYPVAPNNAVALWDSSSPVIYLKQTDASGRPNIKVYELKERTDPSSEPPPLLVNDKYVEKTEIELLKTELKNIKKELTAIKRKQEDEDD